MVIYIKEWDENDRLKYMDKMPKFIQKMILKFKEITNNFYIIDINENVQKCIIPNINRKKTYRNIRRRLSKISSNSKRKLKIVLSERMHEHKFEFNMFNVIDGRKVIKDHIEEVIKNVIGDIPLEMQEIYILINNYTQTNLSFIRDIAFKVKSTNIITNRIERFKELEENMLEKGVAINVANNKRKSLKNAKIIVNIDFTKEDIKKYNIFRTSCIIDISSEKIVDDIKGFDGIVIQNIEPKIDEKDYVLLKENNLINKFSKIEIYESLGTDNNKIEILSLYGRSGKISEKERLIVKKILTNCKI